MNDNDASVTAQRGSMRDWSVSGLQASVSIHSSSERIRCG
jgi:hypothetical protein